MKKQVTYEWCCEITDEHGDIVDMDFCDTLTKDFCTEGQLVLVRNTGNDAEGLVDRAWAYVNNGSLPESFCDESGNQIGIKVPNRFITELSRKAS